MSAMTLCMASSPELIALAMSGMGGPGAAGEQRMPLISIELNVTLGPLAMDWFWPGALRKQSAWKPGIGKFYSDRPTQSTFPSVVSITKSRYPPSIT